MKCAAYVARLGEIRNAYKIWSKNLKERADSEDLSLDGRTILEWNLRKEGGNMWTLCM